MSKSYELISKPDLYQQWTALDDREIQKNPISVRLPIHVLARLAALAEVFPKRTRSDLIVDLMKAGLETLERESLPVEDTREAKASKTPSPQFVMGMLYRKAANKHYKQMAKEIGVASQEIFPIAEKK